MKIIKLLFFTLIACSSAHAVEPFHATLRQGTTAISHALTMAVFDLWRGIEQADTNLVLRTIRKHPHVMHVKFGHFGDTPLMAALRKYGQALQAMHERPTRLSMGILTGSLIAAVVAGELVSYMTNKPFYSFLTGTVVFAYACSALASRHALPHEKIVTILLQATSNFTARNREGLTALDVLRAYHQYAQELKEPSWFHFHSWLHVAMQENT